MKSSSTEGNLKRGAEYGVVHGEAIRAGALLSILSREFMIEDSRAGDLIELGSVYVNENRTIDREATVESGSRIRVHLEPRRYRVPALRERIVQTYPDFYVVDKPSGLPTHALVDNRIENLISGLSIQLGESLFITHRLDIETSGLLIVARNPEAAARVNALIASKAIRRFYRAETSNPVSLGRHIHYLEPSPNAPKRVSVDPHPDWKRCELEVLRCTSKANDGFEVEIELHTGRSQQIRAQLAAMNAPIDGDRAYGSKVDLGIGYIALRADRIDGFPEPSIDQR
jgi:23S rRNA pseudouridine1911/1915/1917 synthase